VVTLCRVVFESDGCYLCQKDKAKYDPKVLLRNSLFPYPFDDKETMKFRINGKVVDGFLLAKDEQCYYSFLGKYSLDCQKDSDSVKLKPHLDVATIYKFKLKNKKDPHIMGENIGYEILLDEEDGSKLIFMKDSIVAFAWKEDAGTIAPRFLGKCCDNPLFFFYGSLNGDKSRVVLRSTEALEDVPPSLLADFTEDDDVLLFGSNEEWGSHRWLIKKDSEVIDDCYADFMPFPPFDVIGAIKLLPPEVVAKSTLSELPNEMKHPFFLKTCLIPSASVPILNVGRNELKSFSLHIQRNLYYPNIKTEDPQHEYRNLYKNSAGYVLLCQPKFPVQQRRT